MIQTTELKKQILTNVSVSSKNELNTTFNKIKSFLWLNMAQYNA